MTRRFDKWYLHQLILVIWQSLQLERSLGFATDCEKCDNVGSPVTTHQRKTEQRNEYPLSFGIQSKLGSLVNMIVTL